VVEALRLDIMNLSVHKQDHEAITRSTARIRS
jgi:hypothetical protein